MNLPNKKEIEKILKELEKVEPTRTLPDDASTADRLKYELCKQFVLYIQDNKITQKELADQIGVDPARISEIVKYRIELFTVDRLLDYLELLKPKLNVIVA
jgi:predicted XRE-type DNA-binding protein